MPTALRGHVAADAELSPLESDLYESVDPQQIRITMNSTMETPPPRSLHPAGRRN